MFRQQTEAWISVLGRGLLFALALTIPLVFCRETMYIFQIKTLLLQWGGLMLLLSMVIHGFVFEEVDDFWRRPAVMFILLFLIWQVWKSFDSVAPEISWRQMSRIFWLPIVALSLAYFCRQLKQVRFLLDAVIISAVLVNLYAWVVYLPSFKSFFMGTSIREGKTLLDLYDVPVLGDLMRMTFYPSEFYDIWEKKIKLRDRSGESLFPLTTYSFFPGKKEAGTFGNKNFLAGYINLTSILMLWRAGTIWLDMTRREGLALASKFWRAFVITFLVLLAFASFYHLIQLGNRGSWLGFAFGGVCSGLLITFIVVPKGERSRFMIILLLLMGLVVGTLYKASPQRFVSIFNTDSGSNELRRLIWTHFGSAWWSDRDWEGFEGDVHRRLTGFGNYSFRVIYPKVRAPRIFKIEYDQHNTETSHPHNEYLGYLTELGIVGLMLYLAMFGFVLIRFLKSIREGEWELVALKGALLFAVMSQFLHQFVGVGVRYTGLAFQLWLTLGFLMALSSINRNQIPMSDSKLFICFNQWRRKVFPTFLLLLAFVVMPNPLWPLKWFRSQHYFEMGQIYYGSVRDAQEQRMEHRRLQQQLAAQVQVYQNKKKALPEILQKNIQMSREKGMRLEQMLNFYAPLADRYFKASFDADPANFESLYIGANMNVQLANGDLALKNTQEAHRLFGKALVSYEQIEKVMPYFVQVHYWKGICFKGMGTLVKDEADADKFFKLALSSFDQYEKQDPIYKDLFLDRYFCYSRLHQPQKALNELVLYLLNYEEAGEPLFAEQKRYDARYIMDTVLKGIESEQAGLALELTLRLLDYRASTCLLPFVPKTDRHVKNSFRLLREQ